MARRLAMRGLRRQDCARHPSAGPPRQPLRISRVAGPSGPRVETYAGRSRARLSRREPSLRGLEAQRGCSAGLAGVGPLRYRGSCAVCASGSGASVCASAFASIWRMRSRVTENCCPTSSKRVVGVHADAEAHAQDALLARGQRGQHPGRRLAQIGLDRGVQRQDRVLVLDEIAEMANPPRRRSGFRG